MSKLINKRAGGSFDEFMEEQGLKFDQEKLPLELLPDESLEEIAKTLDFGAKKYGRFNWAKGISYSRLIGAAKRHLGEVNKGNDIDEESQCLHAAQVATNMLFLIWMIKHRPELDDRWKGSKK